MKYLESVPPAESLGEGECFVFDERVAVDHRLQKGHYALCSRCGQPVKPEDTADTKANCANCRRNTPDH